MIVWLLLASIVSALATAGLLYGAAALKRGGGRGRSLPTGEPLFFVRHEPYARPKAELGRARETANRKKA